MPTSAAVAFSLSLLAAAAQIAFPPQFQGLPYDQAVKAMYLNHGAILIGARNMVTAGEPTK